MILTKDELIGALNNEVKLLDHLASKIGPGQQDYRPTPGQRSTLELLQYLTLVGPIHMRGALSEKFDMNEWRGAWAEAEATSRKMNVEQAREAIGRLPSLFAELLGPATDEFLRGELEMFGSKTTRGSWLVSLVLCHYAAYRMQLFLYLKSSGRPELNTLNLWVGVDGPMKPME